MVVASSFEPTTAAAKAAGGAIRVVDMSSDRVAASKLVVTACEELGFFKVTNHGVTSAVVARMEEEGREFFSLPASEKARAGPAAPLGYGVRSIGTNGDAGELEYLLLSTDPGSVSRRAHAVSGDPRKFTDAVNEYVGGVRRVACDVLEMIAEGLGLRNTEAMSKLIRDGDSDSLLRLNYYPPPPTPVSGGNCNPKESVGSAGSPPIPNNRVGFGEHTDPQIITVLRSNDVAGLQILSEASGTWLAVEPDPSAFYVMVGDLLQAMTNGRLRSVKHRAMSAASVGPARLSVVFFGAPPLHTRISPLPEMVRPGTSSLRRRYRSFTWGEFKKTMYTLRLGYDRLELYRVDDDAIAGGGGGDDEDVAMTIAGGAELRVSVLAS